MIVCVCRRVSHTTLQDHARSGASFADLQIDLGVATQCGRCENCVREVLDQARVTRHAVEGATNGMGMQA